MTAVVLRGDAARLPLPDASVDLICTSPPYFGQRDYGYAGQIGAEPGGGGSGAKFSGRADAAVDNGAYPDNFGAGTGGHANLSARPRTGPWREWHLDRWEPAADPLRSRRRSFRRHRNYRARRLRPRPRRHQRGPVRRLRTARPVAHHRPRAAGTGGAGAQAAGRPCGAGRAARPVGRRPMTTTEETLWASPPSAACAPATAAWTPLSSICSAGGSPGSPRPTLTPAGSSPTAILACPTSATSAAAAPAPASTPTTTPASRPDPAAGPACGGPTSSPADSPASPGRALALDAALTMLATSGPPSGMPHAYWDRDSSSWNRCQGGLDDKPGSAAPPTTWPRSGTTCGGHAYALRMSAHRTAGSGGSPSPGLLPTPNASDSQGGPRALPERRTSRGADHGPRLRDVAPALLGGWGRYVAAVARWEQVTGHPAPDPTVLGTRGQPTLSPRLSEWMMGLPPGYLDVPGVSAAAQKRLAGNGVVPQQAAAALRILLGLDVPGR